MAARIKIATLHSGLQNTFEPSPKLLPDCLALQGLHVEVVSSGGHNEERDDCHVAVTDLREKERTQECGFGCAKRTQCIDTTPQTHTYTKQIVESGQRFQEEVSTFVRELIPSSDEQEQTFIQVEIKVPDGQTKEKDVTPTIIQ